MRIVKFVKNSKNKNPSTKVKNSLSKKKRLNTQVPLKINKEFKTRQELGAERIVSDFQNKILEQESEKKINSIIKISEKSENNEETHQKIVSKLSEMVKTTPEQIATILEQIQQTSPVHEIGKELNEKITQSAQDHHLLKQGVKQNVELQVALAGQVVFDLIQKPIEPKESIIEGKGPFEISTIPEVSFEQTIDLMNNPEKRAKENKVSFETDQETKDIIEQASKENNLSPIDFTIESMKEILSGNTSPEHSAIINNQGFVDTSLTAESIKKLEENLGPTIKELFAKDSEFIKINEHNNNLECIISTDHNGNATIIADGLKPLVVLPEKSEQLIQEITKIETRNALAKIPPLDEQLRDAFSKKQDPVLEEIKKEIEETEEKLPIASEKPFVEERVDLPIKEPQPIISGKKEGDITIPKESPTTPVAAMSGEKKLPTPEKETKDAFPSPSIKEQPKSLSTLLKEKQTPIKEESVKTAPQSGEEKKLPPREQVPVETIFNAPSKKPHIIPGKRASDNVIAEIPIKETIETREKQPSVLENIAEEKENYIDMLNKTPQKTINSLKERSPALQEEAPKILIEVEPKKIPVVASQRERFRADTTHTVKNFNHISTVYQEKGLDDIRSIDPGAEETVQNILEETIKSTQQQLQETQNRLEETLVTKKNQKAVVETKEEITTTKAEALKNVSNVNKNIQRKLNAMQNQKVKQLAKDTIELITRAAKKSITSMETLARISTELTALNNGNFTNTQDILEQLKQLKKELEKEIKQQKQQANELSQMHVREKKQQKKSAQNGEKGVSKTILLRSVLTALTGIITAIAIEEFDDKQITELSQQIAHAQQLIDETGIQQALSEKEQLTQTKRSFLPLINQSTQNKNRTITTAFEAPEKLKKPISVIYKEEDVIPNKKEEATLSLPTNAPSNTLSFRHDQDSMLLGEQLNQIDKKIEKKLRKAEKRIKREQEEAALDISDYKKMYAASESPQQIAQEPTPSPKEKSPITPNTPSYTASYPSPYTQTPLDHSFDMFDFSGLSNDFDHFDIGYFGDLDFLSEFGFEDWEAFGREFQESSLTQETETTKEKTTAAQKETTLPFEENKVSSNSSSQAQEKVGTADNKASKVLDKNEVSGEEEQPPRYVIRTPYTQYLAPALAIITIGCALLFYWFM